MSNSVTGPRDGLAKALSYLVVGIGLLIVAAVVVNLIGPALVAGVVIIWFVVPPAWVFVDGRSRYGTGVAVLWAVFTLCTASLGAIVYTLFSRMERTQVSCPSCNGAIEKSFKICPACGTNLDKPAPSGCPHCGGKVEGTWTYCPHCREEIAS